MKRFLVIAPHTKEGCAKTIQQIEAAGYITHFDWGCKDGEHCGWAIIEAENPKQALLVVPSSHRPQARAIMLTKFGTSDIGHAHS